MTTLSRRGAAYPKRVGQIAEYKCRSGDGESLYHVGGGMLESTRVCRSCEPLDSIRGAGSNLQL
jgi:hypothetical protein